MRNENKSINRNQRRWTDNANLLQFMNLIYNHVFSESINTDKSRHLNDWSLVQG